MTEGHFFVTDRNLKTVENFGKVLTPDCQEWPQRASVLVVGRGYLGQLEGDLLALRPDLQTMALDPTLYFDPEVHRIKKKLPWQSGVYYVLKVSASDQGDQNSYLTADQAQDQHRARLEEHASRDKVAALAPDLPFRSHSLDVVIEKAGPSYFLKDKRAQENYCRQLLRVTKLGGVIYLFDATEIQKNYLKTYSKITVVSTGGCLKIINAPLRSR